jgi:hypothetical protein
LVGQNRSEKKRKNNNNNYKKLELPLQSNSGHHPTPMAPNSKNEDDYQFERPRSTWKPNFAQIGGFLYFGGHFGFKMAAIANQNGRHMVQHVLLPVNIHFH